jgi:hypothetical protein
MCRVASFGVVSTVFLRTANCQEQGPGASQGSDGRGNAGMTFRW